MIKWIHILAVKWGLLHSKIFYRVEVEIKAPLPVNEPLIICSNHLSQFDMFLISSRFPGFVRYMAKKELFKNPIVAKILDFVGAFPIDRDKPDVSSIKTALKIIKDGGILGIFPEGTRAKFNSDGTFERPHPKQGAIMIARKTNVRILPVAIKSDYKWFSKVKIVFGEPFYVEKGEDSSAEAVDKMSVELMNKIYKYIS